MATFTRPYQPSWVDRFTDWMDRLSLPSWVIYLGIYLTATLFLHLAVWLDGVVPVGQIDDVWVFNGIWSVISLFFIHMLERGANRAVQRFAPLVPEQQEKLEEYRYSMTTMPARTTLVISLGFALLMVVVVLFRPTFLYAGLSHPVSYLLAVSVFAFSYSFAPLLIYQGARLLKYVTKVYELVHKVNVFHQQPLYAFSGLTLQASLFWIVMANLNVVQNALGALSPDELIFNYFFSAIVLVLAFLTFVFPLWGIHRRLVEAKEQVLEENSIQIQGAQQKLYAAINQDDYDKISGLDSAIGSLYKVREQLKSIPTWPWSPGTLRNFLSAVFLPMSLWVLQALLSRYL